jgi:predicted RNase H-like HicB family nuclease
MVKEAGVQVVALVHEENGAYGVSFPDFPGCTTVAGDPDTALAKAAEALAFHVEGLAEDGDLPAVRPLAQLKADPIFRDDARGAMIALVPYEPPARAVRVNITLDEALLNRIDRAAENEGETRSGFIAEAARRRLAENVTRMIGRIGGRKAASAGKRPHNALRRAGTRKRQS